MVFSIWNFSGIHLELFHGIQGGYAPIPYRIDHSMIIPHGIHDVYGIRNWLGPLPTSIPWIPGGFHMDYTEEGKDLQKKST